MQHGAGLSPRWPVRREANGNAGDKPRLSDT